MGDFPEVPTREELYAKVNDWFAATHPDAPEALHPTSAEHAEWRREWLRLRDDLLNAETNRIYWEAYPTGPEKIDPSNPEHDAYEQAWLDIRRWILDNTPDPFGEQEMAEAEVRYREVLEGLGGQLGEDLDPILSEVPDDVRDSLLDAIEGFELEVSNAYKAGEVPELKGDTRWYGTWREFTSASEPAKGVKIRPWAYMQYGRLGAGLESEVRGN